MADEEQGGLRRWVMTIASTIATLPLLYALSIGPAVWWVAQQDYPVEQIESLESFYGPLILVYDNCPPIGDALEWYVELWE